MENADREVVTSTLEKSVVEFFQAYGVACNKADEAPSIAGPEMGSLVGFRGKSLRGGLAFVASADFVERLLPVPKRPARGELQLRDWSAEIANQLVGRLKNKLSAHEINFEIGTPVCFRGSSIRLSFLPDADGVTLDFAAGSDQVRVYLDCALAPADGTPLTASAPRIVTEGDVVLF